MSLDRTAVDYIWNIEITHKTAIIVVFDFIFIIIIITLLWIVSQCWDVVYWHFCSSWWIFNSASAYLHRVMSMHSLWTHPPCGRGRMMLFVRSFEHDCR